MKLGVQRPAAARPPKHRYCRDPDCHRPACLGYREGYTDGNELGIEQGLEEGAERGYQSGYAAGQAGRS